MNISRTGRLAVRFDRGGLDHDIEPIFSVLSSDPLELDEGYGGGKALRRPRLRASEMDPIQLLESLARALLDTRGNLLEIAVMGQEDAVTILRDLRNDRVRGIRGQDIAKACDRVAAGL